MSKPNGPHLTATERAAVEEWLRSEETLERLTERMPNLHWFWREQVLERDDPPGMRRFEFDRAGFARAILRTLAGER